MLILEPVPEAYSGITMHDYLINSKATTLKEKISAAIKLVKTLPINGCITGSCFLPNFDPDNWNSTPDIDIFVFGVNELIAAINLIQHTLKMTPGEGDTKSQKREEWKLETLMRNGVNTKISVTTYKFFTDGIMLNVTYKMHKHNGRWYPILSTPEVLASFDMSIVMQGYDIKHHLMYDMRVGDPMIAIPNPLRDQNCMIWTVEKWVRQFDRVVKYYNRGFDTRPMAKFYIKMIDECIAIGCLFESEESQTLFNEYTEAFKEKREQISKWLNEHRED